MSNSTAASVDRCRLFFVCMQCRGSEMPRTHTHTLLAWKRWDEENYLEQYKTTICAGIIETFRSKVERKWTWWQKPSWCWWWWRCPIRLVPDIHNVYAIYSSPCSFSHSIFVVIMILAVLILVFCVRALLPIWKYVCVRCAFVHTVFETIWASDNNVWLIPNNSDDTRIIITLLTNHKNSIEHTFQQQRQLHTHTENGETVYICMHCLQSVGVNMRGENGGYQTLHRNNIHTEKATSILARKLVLKES